MKLSTACVVFAAFAVAAPVRANPVVSTTVSFIGDVFIRLIKTQMIIKKTEEKNHEVLLPALNDISRELHEGLESDIFRMGSGIHNTLVDVNMKIGQISGNATSILSQIESVAHTISTMNLNNARSDYNIKSDRIKKLCEDTLAMTNVVLQLIDETKEMLGRGVSGPLQMLQLTIQLTSDDRLVRERANIQLQRSIITNPPRKWLFFTDYKAVKVAKSLKRVGESTVYRIEKLVTTILDHTKWLKGICLIIREELDKERTDISMIEGKIKGTRETVHTITDAFHDENMSDANLRELSQNLVQVMNNLRDEVFNRTGNRIRRAAGSYYNAATEPYQIRPENSSQSVFLGQTVKPSWLDKTSDNRCYYIYYNRTTDCIFVKTFDYMKEQYTSLTKKVLEFQALFKAYEKGWSNLATQVLNVSKNSENRRDLIILETNKVMWSDDIKTLRDLSVSLNSYAESLFLEANAQLKAQRSNDTLNEAIMRTVDDNKKTATEIIDKNVNDILIINKLVADILSRLSVNEPCIATTQLPPEGYSNFAPSTSANLPQQSAAAINVWPLYKSTPSQQGFSSSYSQSYQHSDNPYGVKKTRWW